MSHKTEDLIRRCLANSGALPLDCQQMKCLSESGAMSLMVERDQLKELCLEQHHMLRAFRKSMDSNLPFPSAEKLDLLIKEFNDLPQST